MSIVRVGLIRMPAADGTEAAQKSLQEFQDTVSRIKTILRQDLPESIQRLRQLLDLRKMPEIDLQVRLVDTPYNNLEESLLEASDGLPQIRFHFSYKPLKHGDGGLQTSFSISHLLVAAEPTPGSARRERWSVAQDSIYTFALCERDKWPALIHDVLLDIAVFHASSGPHKHYTTFAKKIWFSQLKAQYICNHLQNTSTYYGAVDANTAYPYLPLSLLSRITAENDLGEYAKHWQIFIHDILQQSHPSGLSAAALLLTTHPKRESISPQRITRLLKALPPGKYALIRGEALPPHPPLRATVLGVFNSTKGSWHVGLLKVILEEEIAWYRKLRPYVSIFEFEVTEL